MQDVDSEFSITILIVEGNNVDRRNLSETLTALGYGILQASDVIAGADILTKHKIDLIMTDVFMPSGEGVDFLLAAKRERPETAVIIMSSLMDDGIRDDLIGSGADGVLVKPFRIAKVEELISTILMKYDRSTRAIRHSNKKIMVIDDDPGLLEFMSEGLKILGYEVVAKRDAASALETFSEENPDLVISDFMLSGLCGIELINKLKKIRPQIPGVIVTGYPAAYPSELAKVNGIAGYLIKPFRINQLEQVVAGLLYREKVGEENSVYSAVSGSGG